MSKAIKLKNWSHGFITKYDGGSGSLNIDMARDGTIRPREGWKTFAGMVHQLWLINKRFQKQGLVGDFTVRLPLKAGGFRKERDVRANNQASKRASPKDALRIVEEKT